MSQESIYMRKCNGCGHKWHEKNAEDTECPECGSIMCTEPMYTMEELKINENSHGIAIRGHVGKWNVIDKAEWKGDYIYLLEHSFYGDEAACLVVDEYRNILCDEAWNGFDDFYYMAEDVDTDENDINDGNLEQDLDGEDD